MRTASRADKEKVIEILSAAYDTNPSVNWIIKNDKKRLERIKALASYSFETGMDRNGVFISSDGNGCAIFFKQNFKKNSLKDYLRQIELLIRAIGIFRIGEVLLRERYVAKMRPSNGEFLNFWFFGVLPGKSGGNAAKELKDHVFKISEESKLPIYVETTIDKNKRVYERYGFKTFHTWNVQGKNINLYFLRRDPTTFKSEKR